MYIYGTDISRIFIAPYDIQKIFSAVYLVRIEYQQFQHIKFLGCEVDLFSGDKYAASFAVQLQFSDFHSLGLLLLVLFAACTADDRLDAGFDFQDVERLGDIIISSVFQTQDLIHIFSFCCKHDDRNIGKFTDLLAYLKTVHFWKHQVKKDDIVLSCFCFFQCFLSVIGTVHFHSVLLQTEAKSLDNQFLIIYYQYFPAHLALLTLLLFYPLSSHRFLL